MITWGCEMQYFLTTSFQRDVICDTLTGEGTSGVSLEEFQKGNSALFAQKMDPELDVGHLYSASFDFQVIQHRSLVAELVIYISSCQDFHISHSLVASVFLGCSCLLRNKSLCFRFT